MFHFGLFTTHIPYIIITIAYVLYFGTNVLNNPECISATEENTYISSHTLTLQTNNNSVCYTTLSKLIEAEDNSVITPHPPDNYLRSKRYISFDNKHVLNQSFKCRLETRPPPRA